MVRAKMRCSSIEVTDFGAPEKSTKVRFLCEYDPNKSPEDIGFTKATPSGNAEYVIDNPAALEQFKVGAYYYVDFTPVPKPEG